MDPNSYGSSARPKLKREFGGFDATAPTGTQFPSRVDRNAKRTPSVGDATSRLWPELGSPRTAKRASLPLSVAAAFIAGVGAVMRVPQAIKIPAAKEGRGRRRRR